MRLLVTPTFERALKKLHRQQKFLLDDAIRLVLQNPDIGEAKVGDLAGVKVHKFRMENLVFLIACRVIDRDTIKLLMFGPHENFYRDLKRTKQD